METKRVSIPKLPEEPLAQINNKWLIAGEQWYRIELKHNNPAGDPFSKCEGVITITLFEKQRGTKQVPCRKCQEEVNVSITQLLVGLELLPTLK